MLLILMLVVILMGSAAYYLWGRAATDEAQRPRSSHQTPSEGELALPMPERPVESPPQPLGLGLGGGAFFDSDWDDDDEAATEVAVMPPTPAPAPMRSGLAPMAFGALQDADDQATEVMDANANAELAAALRAVEEEEIPSFGDRGGAYFDDDWDDDEAPTAVMTGDMADKYAEMLRNAGGDEDEPPAGPGRVVAKKD